MPKSTNQLIAELKTLAGQGKKNIFRRVQLASQILADHDWIASKGWDEPQAREALQADYFSELGGYVSLGTLLEIYAKFPHESDWEEYNYNIRAMELLWRQNENDANQQSQERTKWKAKAEYLDNEVKEMKYEISRKNSMVDALEKEIVELNGKISSLLDENRQLREENAGLRGRLEELERFARQEFAAPRV